MGYANDTLKDTKNALQLNCWKKLHETSRTKPAGRTSWKMTGERPCHTITQTKGASLVLTKKGTDMNEYAYKIEPQEESCASTEPRNKWEEYERQKLHIAEW